MPQRTKRYQNIRPQGLFTLQMKDFFCQPFGKTLRSLCETDFIRIDLPMSRTGAGDEKALPSDRKKGLNLIDSYEEGYG